MKDKIEALLTVKDMTGKDTFKILAAIAPLMEAIEEQHKSERYDVPDDAWLMIPHDMRAAMLQTMGLLYLQAIQKK